MKPTPRPNFSPSSNPNRMAACLGWPQCLSSLPLPPPLHPKQDGCLPTALRELEGKRRALIVTDKTLMDMGLVGKVTSVLHEMHMQYQVFFLVRGSLNGKAAASCTVACTARPSDTAVFSFRCAPDL